jgi:hypothetical protein
VYISKKLPEYCFVISDVFTINHNPVASGLNLNVQIINNTSITISIFDESGKMRLQKKL